MEVLLWSNYSETGTLCVPSFYDNLHLDFFITESGPSVLDGTCIIIFPDIIMASLSLESGKLCCGRMNLLL